MQLKYKVLSGSEVDSNSHSLVLLPLDIITV